MKKIICIFIMCLLIISSEAQNVPINILPLGNSITAAINVGYREKLYASLNAANINFKYVGKFGDDPFKHSGVSSYTSGMILNDLDVLTQDYTFDYVLLHIGTNDIHWPDIDINTTKNNINQIIEKLKTKNPEVVIFLAQIILSLNPNYPLTKIQDLNKVVMQLAVEQKKNGVHIVVVDHYTAFLKTDGQPDANLFISDQVHPNDDGYSVMAKTWFQAIDGVKRGLTKGAGEQYLGKGEKKNEVTDENVWRWSEYYYGYLNISNIVEEEDACKAKHTYVFGEVDGAIVEYRMKFGGDYSMLVLRGKADDPAPIKMEIYVDTELKATATWDNGDNCNEETTVYIPDVDYGTHYIAVKYIKDSPDPIGNYQRFYFDGLKVISAKYKATADWTSLNKHNVPAWVDDAKLGLSIHWGVYSVPAYAPKKLKPPYSYAEWYGYYMQKEFYIYKNAEFYNCDNFNSDDQKGKKEDCQLWKQYIDNSVYEYHLDNYSNKGVKPYDYFIPQWIVDDYKPEAWAKFAKDTLGAKYIFITSKHHDGFCLWPTKTTHRNSVEMGPNKDLIGPFVKAARDIGLKVGFYYSLYEWFNPDYHKTEKNCKGEDVKPLPVTADLNENDLTITEGLYNGYTPLANGQNYVDDYMIPQLKELIDLYHPDLLYFDGEDKDCNGLWDYERKGDYWKMNEVVAYYYNQAEARGQEVYVNDRLGGPRATNGDLYNVEHGWGANNIGTGIKWSYWQGISNTFGYNKDIKFEDCHGPNWLIEQLAKAVCLNGNFDINVGPMANGTIPEYERRRLKQMGDWLKVNGEAIYGTRFWNTRQFENSGISDINNNPILSKCFTVKGSYLYAICVSWPGIELKLKDVYAVKGSTVQLLGEPVELTWKNESDGLKISYPEDTEVPYRWAYTFKIKIKEGAKVMYFNDGSLDQTTTLVHPVVFDEVDKIDFNWWEGTPDIKIGSRTEGENNFSARYDGTIKVTLSGRYTFRIVADDGVRFWINDDLQGKRATIERWNDNRENNFPYPEETAFMTLIAGKQYPFRLEYFHRGNALDKDASLRLEWKTFYGKWEVVPSEAFGPPLEMPEKYGLQGSYYNDPDSIADGNEIIVRTDQQINFNWDTHAPDSRMDDDGKYAVVWEGKIMPLYDGTYNLFASYDGNIESMNLYFLDNLLSPMQGQSKQYLVENLKEGEKYKIRIEYKKSNIDESSKGVRLEWESVDKKQNRQLVPPYCLFPPSPSKPDNPSGDPVNGLKGMYYNIPSNLINNVDWPGWPNDNSYPNPNLFYPTTSLEVIGDSVVRDVNNLNFNWWAGSPDYRIGADYFVSKWVGKITLPQTEKQEGLRQFEWTTDDGGILYIDGNKIIDTWTDRSSSKTATFNMKPGEDYDFCAMQFERGGSASTKQVLSWAKLNTNNATLNTKKGNAEKCPIVYEVVPPEAFIYPKTESSKTTLTVQDGYGHPGSTVKVNLNLENSLDIAGLQLAITDIPEFLTVKGVGITNRTTGFDTGFKEGGTGTPIIMIYNTSGKVISPGKGPIAEITFEVSSNATIGQSSQLQLKEVILSDPKSASVPVVSVNGVFYFAPLKGDVNGDGFINILDVVRTINIILGVLPEPTRIEKYAADYNTDKIINIADFVGIINLILNKPLQKEGLLVKSQSGNTIELETTDLLAGQNVNTLVKANLADELAGLQLSINHNSKNLELGEITTTVRSTGMNISSFDRDGVLTVLLYSLDGSVIKPGEGPLISISSKVKGDTKGIIEPQLKDVILVASDAREIPVSIITGIDDIKESMPKDFLLYQNYPNPFKSETFIKYGLPKSADVQIKVYNLLGQEIRNLVSEHKEAGFYTVTWDALDNSNSNVSPGIYIYEFTADDNLINKKKMIVLK